MDENNGLGTLDLASFPLRPLPTERTSSVNLNSIPCHMSRTSCAEGQNSIPQKSKGSPTLSPWVISLQVVSRNLVHSKVGHSRREDASTLGWWFAGLVPRKTTKGQGKGRTQWATIFKDANFEACILPEENMSGISLPRDSLAEEGPAPPWPRLNALCGCSECHSSQNGAASIYHPLINLPPLLYPSSIATRDSEVFGHRWSAFLLESRLVPFPQSRHPSQELAGRS